MNYTYTFSFNDGTERSFDLRLSPDSLEIVAPQSGKSRSDVPEWTKLGFKQCPNCPLSTAEHEKCPVAANITDVVDFFKDRFSYEDVVVTIENESRTYTKKPPFRTA